MDSSWHWDGTGTGSALWYNDTCGQARTGCGGVLMRQRVSGYRAVYTTVHLSALSNGWCSIGYYAQLWNSSGPATARLEILDPDWTYVSLTDRTLTNSMWTYVGTGFEQWAARDVIIRITLPGSGSNANSSPTINADDLNVHCMILLEGRG